MTRGKEFTMVNGKMAFIVRATIALAVALVVTAGTPAQAQSCTRTITNIPIQNLVDFQNSTVTNMGSNVFRIHWAYASDPNITLICADSGQNPPCGFDGVFFRNGSSNILAESDFGSCNLKSNITTNGTSPVTILYELKFEYSGIPSKQTFGTPPGGACLTTDPNVIPVGQTLPLGQLLC